MTSVACFMFCAARSYEHTSLQERAEHRAVSMRAARLLVLAAGTCALVGALLSARHLGLLPWYDERSPRPGAVLPSMHTSQPQPLPQPASMSSAKLEPAAPPRIGLSTKELRRVRTAIAPPRVSAGAAMRSDPRRVPWGANVTLHGRPPAIVLFAPHKTASTFFTSLLHDMARLLGLCWYSDNVAFTYAPADHAKCASPSCGHSGTQRSFGASDGGWGDCAAYAEAQILVASTCARRDTPAVSSSSSAAAGGSADSRVGGTGGDGEDGRCSPPPLSAVNGVAWGAVRLPPAMRRALASLGSHPWHWYVVLHQRHPGDTLVSEYYSFGWSHPAAPNATPEQRAKHALRQATIRNTSVARYVAEHLPELKRKYAPYLELTRTSAGGVGGGVSSFASSIEREDVSILRSRYEDLVTDFPSWLRGLVQSLHHSYTPETLAMLREALYRRHRKAFKADGRHRRSVAPGRYALEVEAATTREQSRQHREWWEPLGYA